jgi:hypothetical protein
MQTLLILTAREIESLTGYAAPGKQLCALHAAGYVRARRGRHGEVILEKAHYHAVCRGEFSKDRGQPQPSVNIAFLKRT